MREFIQQSQKFITDTTTKIAKSSPIQNFIKDLSSLKTLWNYVYMSLYVFLCIWGAIHYPQTSLNTSIITTGSLVGAIFTSFVFSKSWEKIKGVDTQPQTPQPPSQPSTGSGTLDGGDSGLI